MDDHDHASDFDIPGGDPHGRGVDITTLATFVGAAFDGCTSCQDPALTLLVEDAATTARLVELACMFTDQAAGGLPASLTDDGVEGPASPEFRRLARTGADGANDAMFVECQKMIAEQRRAAANSAADIIVGHLAMG